MFSNGSNRATDNAIRILIADDHKIVRQGLLLLLKEADFKEVYEADGGASAVQLARKLKPDVIVMDLHMPDMNGIDAARAILADAPSIRIIVLTSDSDKRFMKMSFQAGAVGYLLKDCAVEELTQAIRAVATGGKYLSNTVSSIIIDRMAADISAARAAVKTPLTTRETEVLRAVAEGLTTKEIAATLTMSIRTVETHRKTISEKLGLNSIADFTRYALRLGLISD
jgi:DNA-binding NarL/FixJ family response regulator